MKNDADRPLVQDATMPQVLKKDIARDFFSTPACSDYQSVPLSARGFTNSASFGNAVLIYQPFRSGRIDESHVDLVTVLPAELLKRSVGDEGIDYLQFAFADQGLHLANWNPEQIGRALPGIRVVLCR
jgi:hypothetical protein